MRLYCVLSLFLSIFSVNVLPYCKMESFNKSLGNTSQVIQPWRLSNESKAVVVVVGGVILMTYICISNGLVIAIILKNRHLRRTRNIFIISQSVADLLIGILTVPMRLVQETLHGDQMQLCRGLLITQYSLSLVSVFTTMAICIYRYILTFHPLNHNRLLSNRRCYISLILIWTYSFLLCAAGTLIPFPIVEESDPCIGTTAISHYYLSMLVAHMILPCLTGAILYVRIFSIAYKARHAIVAQMSVVNHQAAVDFQRESKITQKMVLTLGILAVCYLPCVLVAPFVDWDNASMTRLCLQALIYSNSGHNVCVYAFSDRQLRESMVGLLQIH